MINFEQKNCQEVSIIPVKFRNIVILFNRIFKINSILKTSFYRFIFVYNKLNICTKMYLVFNLEFLMVYVGLLNDFWTTTLLYINRNSTLFGKIIGWRKSNL